MGHVSIMSRKSRWEFISYSCYFIGYEPSKNATLKAPPRHGPARLRSDTPWLRARNIDPKSIHDYVARGWLERLVRGVYRRPAPQGAPGGDRDFWAILLLPCNGS